ncbi:MAG: hypothetical protein RLZ99_348 [Actinomycetota bacterium]|jgi:hypothetical protein
MGLKRTISTIAAMLLVGLSLPAQGLNLHQAPKASSAIEGSRASADSVIRVAGWDFKSVEQVLIDGRPTTFQVISNTLIAIRIPLATNPGDVTITLVSDQGQTNSNFKIEIVSLETQRDTKVTIGSFLGYVAVYTKNLSGQKLSIQVGSKRRDVSVLTNDYTVNLTKVGSNRLVEVRVFVAGQLVESAMVLVR